MEVAALRRGEAEIETLFDFEVSSPANFAFSADGRYLYGSSYYSGVSNIYRYEIEKQDMSILSNAETGFFRPLALSDDDLLVFEYSGSGLTPGIVPNRIQDHLGSIDFLGNEIVTRHPVVRDWKVPPPSTVEVEEVTEKGSYNTFSRIQFQSIYPIVEGYKDRGAAGFRLGFSDPLNLSGLDLTFSFSPHDGSLEDSESLHAVIDFHHWSWNVRATYNGGDFYDLFGPTRVSRKGYSLGVDYNKTLKYDEPKSWRLEVSLTGWGGLETLPDFQEIEAPEEELLTARVSLAYEFFEKSLGAVEDAEKGIRWEVLANLNITPSQSSPILLSHLDLGFPLPLDHSSIWFRSSAGHSFGDAGDPFAQIFFGSFGNNYVDHREEKRFRKWYSFLGVDINEIAAESYAKLTLEWTLPPLRFRNLGAPGFYANWARFAFFSSGLLTELEDPGIDRTLVNFGLQIDIRLVFFSNLKSTLSLGYAVALEEDQDSRDEFMVSLKIL